MQDYTVSIPLEPVTDSEQGTTYSLQDGLSLGDELRVRVVNDRTYIDLHVQAEQDSNAIDIAQDIARRFIHLLVLVQEVRFQISPFGLQLERWPVHVVDASGNVPAIVAIRGIGMAGGVGIMGRGTITAVSLERVAPPWGQLKAQSSDATARGLEWVYRAKTTRDPVNAFLAYYVALEVLLEGHAGENAVRQALQQNVASKAERKVLLAEVETVLMQHGLEEHTCTRIKDAIIYCKAESDPERWQRILADSGVDVPLGELETLRRLRGKLVHEGNDDDVAVATDQLSSIVTTHLNALLRVP